jgi:hypothetical protein
LVEAKLCERHRLLLSVALHRSDGFARFIEKMNCKWRETRFPSFHARRHILMGPFFRCGIADPLGVCDVKDQFGLIAEAIAP